MPFAFPAIPALNENARAAAAARQNQLTKPPGALGRLEELSLQLAAIQGVERPRCEKAQVLVFAGDHGVTARGVSPFPSAVTAQMCLNFCAGGAAVNVLARQAKAKVEVVNVGVATDLPVVKGLVRARVAPGTADFTVAPAMTTRQCERAMMLGAKRAQHAAKRGVQALVLGEMGIGNTTSAAALMAAYLDLPPTDCCGRGTGCDDAGLERKRAAVAAGLARLARGRNLAEITPFGILAELGGLEIAALAGAMLAAAAARLTVVVDGFICSAAALAALRIDPAVQPYLVWSHCGSEQGHRRLLEAVGAKPLIALDLRLGEGTGGVLALHLLRAACRTLDEMATFTEAKVSGKS